MKRGGRGDAAEEGARRGGRGEAADETGLGARRYFGRDAAALAAKKVAGVPLKRLGEVEEVVEAVAFLLSDDSSYVTGTSLVIAGGMA